MTEKSQESEGSLTQAKENDKAIYEIGFHVVPTVSEGEVSTVVERLHAALAKADAEVISQEMPKKIQFTYRIERSRAGKREKYAEGYFSWVKFATDSTAIVTLEQTLRSDADILRYLLIHTTREQITAAPRVFSSDRLEGETITKHTTAERPAGEVSEEELEKSLEAIVS